jgi:phosphatidylglycerophosphate synthase
MAWLNFLTPAMALASVLLMEILDGLDGALARRFGPSAFGASWDMESDAFVILLLSVGAFLFAGLPVWALWPGLARYLFYFPYKFLKPPSIRMPALWSFFSKTVCVAAVFCMASPWYLPAASRTAAAVISVLLAISFLWEGLLYIQVRIQTRNR